MNPAYRFHLNQPILPRLATVGKYDGTHAALTAATTGGKVFIHDPHRRSEDEASGTGGAGDLRFLDVSQTVTGLLAGKLHSDSTKDLLLVRRPYSIFSTTTLLSIPTKKKVQVPITVIGGLFSFADGPSTPLPVHNSSQSSTGFHRLVFSASCFFLNFRNFKIREKSLHRQNLQFNSRTLWSSRCPLALGKIYRSLKTEAGVYNSILICISCVSS